MNHSRSLATTGDVDLCSLVGYSSYFALASSRSWAHVTAGCARHCAAMSLAVLARHITLQSTGHHPCRACTRVKIFLFKKKKNLVFILFFVSSSIVASSRCCCCCSAAHARARHTPPGRGPRCCCSSDGCPALYFHQSIPPHMRT